MNLARLAARFALFAAAATMLGTAAHAQDKVSLRLNWYLGGLHVPFYYGKERGLYASRSTKAAGRRTPCRWSPRARTRSAWPTRRRSS
jgi:hypothetical protein